jgi:hypothetical protein
MGEAQVYYDDDSVAETLAIEQRLRDRGFADLIAVLQLGGDFEFDAPDVAGVVLEANRLLLHQETVDLAGARILAALGELAVKAQAFDAIARLVRRPTAAGDREQRATTA